MADACADNNFRPHDYLFKVVLCGDSGVGKTNILGRYTKDEFVENSPTTIGVEFLTKAMEYDGKLVAIQIWDTDPPGPTAGQERFNAVARSYYRGAVGAFIVYDITRRSSFEHVIDRWLVQLRTHTHQSIVLCLLGNKSDQAANREVTTEEGEALAQKHGMLFFECSAKDATNINKAFERMIVEIYGLVKKPSVASPTQATAATGPDSARAVPEHKPDLYAGPSRNSTAYSRSVDLRAQPENPPASDGGCAC